MILDVNGALVLVYNTGGWAVDGALVSGGDGGQS